MIVEDRADLPFGHYSTLCADLAVAFTDLGHEVELLTTRGWAGEWDGRPRQSSFAVSSLRSLGDEARAARRALAGRRDDGRGARAPAARWRIRRR